MLLSPSDTVSPRPSIAGLLRRRVGSVVLSIPCANQLAVGLSVLAFAEENRREMLESIYDAFGSLRWPDLGIDLTVDTHHNFAAMEHHAGENLMIHRTGAVKATGLVTIPGSMGTASYIGEGLSSPDSFNTCSHGAGRLMGRKVANRTITRAQAVKSMAHVVYGVREGKYDEMPDCYKKIDEVMATQSDLVEPRYRLTPLTVVKG